MSVDKNYCMSSFLAFRYIERADADFAEGLHHAPFSQMPGEKKVLVSSAKDIDAAIQKQFDELKGKRLGILLSGGMDSAILASYMRGQEAYTFRFNNGEYQKEELKRAEYYADYYDLNLHYVDISWDMVEKNIDAVMKTKQAPVHSIEPQVFEGALRAKADGVDVMIIGDASDYVFGGMDGLLSQNWKFEDFYKRFIYVEPADVLKEPVDMHYAFEPFRRGEYIDFLGIMDTITTDESYDSYKNAFKAAAMPYLDPYEELKMAEPLDLKRIRNGESKYLIRELFAMKYPEISVPEKLPMPRPVDEYFRNWEGPRRPEFKENIDMSKFSGNQKWLMWCLERFLNIYC